MSFWQNKKVLITGHTGFKGSWLSLVLQEAGTDLVGFALPPSTQPNLFTLADISRGMTSLFGDIRDFEQILAVFKQHQPEIVVHMAAQPLVSYAYKNPIETYATNVMGTVHLLEAARQIGCVKAIVNVTTDKCYENKEWCWGYRENDTLGGYDPYSNSKASAELVTSSYRHAYFNTMSIGLASVRAGNVIGGGDWAEDRLIPDIIRACMAKSIVLIRHPEAVRPWQHVMEPLSGYLLLAEKLYDQPSVYAGAWNFGPDDYDDKPVSWIVDRIATLLHEPVHWRVDRKSDFHETTYLKLDCSKSKSQLGWQPRWCLEKGLAETVNWYNAFASGVDVRIKTISQIRDFVEVNVHNTFEVENN
ncbi:MAG: CDP-glucose 4,6-dehydratase [Legionellales bacterium RIFCSPHIGHO2_12_FULL_37_14]|nr:MAG: CDP-glucose 4,6-dehydratase [Legionellales bacterium RIFCSPHIGHO2_12_FULL_37_14]